MLRDAFQTRARHFLVRNEPPHALLIHWRQRTAFAARTETLRQTFVVNAFVRAVNPAVTQCFFDHTTVRMRQLYGMRGLPLA